MDWTPGLRGFNQNGVRKRFRKKKRIQSTHGHNPVDKIPGIRLGAGRKQISYGHVVVCASAAASVVVVLLVLLLLLLFLLVLLVLMCTVPHCSCFSSFCCCFSSDSATAASVLISELASLSWSPISDKLEFELRAA